MWVTGFHAIEAALGTAKSGVLWVGKGGQERKRIQALMAKAERGGVTVHLVESSQLPECGRELGVALERNTKPSGGSLEEVMVAAGADRLGLVLLLDGVQDPHNLGACIRAAAVFGVDALVIPKDQAVAVNATVERIASGALAHVPVFQVTNVARFLKHWQAHGWWVSGLAEQGDLSLFLHDFKSANHIIALGSEGKGLRHLTRSCCDHLLAIPAQSDFSTLNVAVATGVTLAQVVRSRLEA